MQRLLRLVLVPAFATLVIAGGACGRSDLFSERHHAGTGGDGSIDVDGGAGFGGSVGERGGAGGSTFGRGGAGGSTPGRGGAGGSTSGRGGAGGSTAGRGGAGGSTAG